MISDVFSCVHEGGDSCQKRVWVHCSRCTCSPLPCLLSWFGRLFWSFWGGLCMSFCILHTYRRVGRYSCASIIKNQEAKCLVFRQYINAIITLIHIIIYYYVLLRIFPRKCCFMINLNWREIQSHAGFHGCLTLHCPILNQQGSRRFNI